MKLALDSGKKQTLTYRSPIAGDERWYKSEISFQEMGPHKRFVVSVVDFTVQKALQDELQEQQALLNQVIDSIPDFIFYKDLAGVYLGCNHEYERLLGKPRREIVGKTPLDFHSAADAELYLKSDQEIIRSGQPQIIKAQLAYPDGAVRLVDNKKAPLLNHKGEIIGILGIGRDMTEHHQYESALKASEEKYRLITENTTDVIWVLNVDKLGFTYFSPSVRQLLGYTAEEAVLLKLEEMLIPDSLTTVRNRISHSLPAFISQGASEGFYDEIQQTCKDGRTIWVEYSANFRYNAHHEIEAVGVSRNIEKRKQQEDRIRYISYHDQLTGLYNRYFYEEMISKPLTADRLPLTLAVADVNGLKLANDAFGHECGDQLLAAFASILSSLARTDDIIARIGGDEFAMILPRTGSAQILEIASRLAQACQNAKIGYMGLSVSIGFTTLEDAHASSLDEAFRTAEDSMYQQKIVAGGRFRNEMVKSIIGNIFQQNPDKQIHSQNVARLCSQIGRDLGLKDAEIAELELAGALHDIGEISICAGRARSAAATVSQPDAASQSPAVSQSSAVSQSDQILKKHALIGYYILHSASDYFNIAETVLAHHERIDGMGYPKGLKGDEIPLFARIIKLASDYEIMVRRDGLSQQEASRQLETLSGKAYDAGLVRLFLQGLPQQTKP